MGEITVHAKEDEEKDVCVDYTGNWQKVPKKEAYYFLYKWIEAHSCYLPCEADAKHMLEELAGEMWKSQMSGDQPKSE